MPTFKEFYFDSSDGLHKIHTTACYPDGEVRATLQIIHGIIEYVDKTYERFMSYLAENGIACFATDHLGHGRSFQDEKDKGYIADKDGWDYIIRDEETLRLISKEQYPDVPQFAFGHSMGSFMLRTLLIRYPDGFDGALVVGTGNQSGLLVFGGLTAANLVILFKGTRHRSKLLNDLAFGSYNKIYDKVNTDYDWISSDPAAVKAYMDDPLCGYLPTCSLFRDMMTGIKFIENRSNIAKMNKDTPVIFLSGKKDPVGECGKGVEKAYSLFKAVGMKDISMKLYPEARHAIINEVNKDEVFADVLAWINSKI